MWRLVLIVLLIAPDYSLSQGTDVCDCVSHYLCPNGTIITDGNVEHLINERLGETCNCNCPDTEVCCFYNATTITTTTTTTPLPLPSSTPCGKRNPEGVDLEASGSDDDAKFGEFPWAVDILLDNGAVRCGGSLIHPSVVLTAAHCVTRKKTYIARAGEWDNSENTEVLKHQDLRVTSIKIHENYNPAVYYNDVALLFLSGSFNLSSHIQPVCLSPTNLPSSNERCYVVGRGKDESGQYRAILKKIDLPLVDKSVCQDNLRRTGKLGQNFRLHSSFLCAGGEKNKDACLGDGGGSLVCPVSGEENIYQQVGVVAWGLGCHEEGVPGVYTNVPVLREWIDKQMKEKNLDTSQYIYKKQP